MLGELPIPWDELPIAVRQADLARLLGTSRMWVSELVQRQVIPTRPNGRIDPNAAVAALLKRDASAHRLKVLTSIRRQLDDAEARAVAAEAVAKQAAARLAAIEADLGRLVALAKRESRWASALIDETAALLEGNEELNLAFDDVCDRALETASNPQGDPFAGVSEELAELVMRLFPRPAEATAPPDLLAAIETDTQPAAALAEGKGAAA